MSFCRDPVRARMMRTTLSSVLIAAALTSTALLITNSRFKSISHLKRSANTPVDVIDTAWPTTAWTTPGAGMDLRGKMFTLSAYGGGIRFYPPHFDNNTPNPWSSSAPYKTTTRPYPTTRYPYPTTRYPWATTRDPYTTTRDPYPTTRYPYPTTRDPWATTRYPYPTTRDPYPTTRYPYPTTRYPYTTTRYPYTTTRYPYTTTRYPYTTTRYPWTTAPPFRGVSVCLRYLSTYQANIQSLFTLSPTTNPLTLGFNWPNTYFFPNQFYYSDFYLKPYINLWSNIPPEIWTRVCLTVDSVRNVAQVFSGSNMSIRKVPSSKYVWSGEPVIDFPGFDGQVTDVQVWDYPLRYKEVFNYMTRGVYATYRGSVLTWSSINYSLRGNTLLEDIYEKQANQPIGSLRGRGRRPKGERKTKEFVNVRERSERNRQRLK